MVATEPVLCVLANTCTLAWPETSVQVGVCPVTGCSSAPPRLEDIALLISQNASFDVFYT